MMDIIEMDQLEESQLKSLFNHYWHDDCMIVSSGVYHLSKLPGFVCVVEEKVYGILTRLEIQWLKSSQLIILKELEEWGQSY